MPNNNLPEFILLSELIQKLKDKDYYRVFAKTLLMTAHPSDALPSNEDLVKEMFLYFIADNQLDIYYDNSVVSLNEISKESEQDWISNKEILVKVKDLKKLYANKCIVLPNSLFRKPHKLS